MGSSTFGFGLTMFKEFCTLVGRILVGCALVQHAFGVIQHNLRFVSR